MIQRGGLQPQSHKRQARPQNPLTKTRSTPKVQGEQEGCPSDNKTIQTYPCSRSPLQQPRAGACTCQNVNHHKDKNIRTEKLKGAPTKAANGKEYDAAARENDDDVEPNAV